MVLLNKIVSLPTYTVLHEKYSSKGTAPKVSKGRRLASGDKKKAERVSRNERPRAATIEAADAPAGAKPRPSDKQSLYARTV